MSHWCCLVTRRSWPMGHVTLPCPLPVCWHLYFLCEMMCSKPKPPNPGPLPFLEAPSPACSPGRWLPSHKSSLCVQLPVLREAARFPSRGTFPLALGVPGLVLFVGPSHLSGQHSQEKELWNPGPCTFTLRHRRVWLQKRDGCLRMRGPALLCRSNQV